MRECGYPGCRTEIPNYLLVCERHWNLIPIQLKNQIRAYVHQGASIQHQLNELRVNIRYQGGR